MASPQKPLFESPGKAFSSSKGKGKSPGKKPKLVRSPFMKPPGKPNTKDRIAAALADL